jgi:serine/threonine-protein kinase HipA
VSSRALDVFCDTVRVGSLQEQESVWSFGYDPAWQGFDLSPALPRAAGRIVDGGSNRPVQWFFDNLLPEEGQRGLLAREARIDQEDAFGLLAYFGAESAGAFVLRQPGTPAPAESGLRPLDASALQARIEALPRVSLAQGAPKRMSMAGAQHKLIVVLQDDCLYEPLPATPSTHLLKPDHPEPDYPGSVANETFGMQLAAALGLPVPAVQLRYVPSPVYLVQRFDRADCATGTRRLPVLDACQLLNKSRTYKYTQDGVHALRQAAEACRERAKARLQLFQWLAFNLMLGNSDAHLKNLSFLIDDDGLRVAPFYDLLCTAVYDMKAFDDAGRWPGVDLALPLPGARQFAGLRRGHIVQAGEELGLARDTAQREFARLHAAFPVAADKVLQDLETQRDAAIAASPHPDEAAQHRGMEDRVLQAIRHGIIAELHSQLA